MEIKLPQKKYEICFNSRLFYSSNAFTSHSIHVPLDSTSAKLELKSWHFAQDMDVCLAKDIGCILSPTLINSNAVGTKVIYRS